jgi:hypothetical protein
MRAGGRDWFSSAGIKTRHGPFEKEKNLRFVLAIRADCRLLNRARARTFRYRRKRPEWPIDRSGSGCRVVTMRSSDPPSVPTLGELHREPGWWWLICETCLHTRAIPLAPFVIRWGRHASSDVLRRNARCSACGHRGAVMRHPSFYDSGVRYQPFPAEQAAR